MKNLIRRFCEFLYKANDFSFVLVFAFMAIFAKIPGEILGEIFVNLFNINYGIFSSDNQLPTLDIIDNIFAWFIAPPIETIIGQLIPILIVKRFSEDKKWWIIISGLIFSLLHLPVVGFLFTAFLIGLILSWAFVVQMRKSLWKAFVIVSIIHGLVNFLPIILLLTIDQLIHLVYN